MSRQLLCGRTVICFHFDDRFQAIQHLLRQFLIYLMNGVTRVADYIVADHRIVIYQVEAGFPPRAADIDNSELILIYRNYFSGKTETHYLFPLLFHEINFFHSSFREARFKKTAHDVMDFFLGEVYGFAYCVSSQYIFEGITGVAKNAE
jgi:hypothetical protein